MTTMLSGIDEFNGRLERHLPYTPSSETLRHMSRVSLTLVTGPAGVGKSTIMRETGLPRVISDTIRAPRSNDGVMEQNGVEYFFRGDTLDDVLAEVAEGSFVQIARGPSGLSFYGSRSNAYPSDGAAVMDVLTPSVPDMLALPFGNVTATHIVAPSYQEWIRRLNGRGTLAPDDLAARLKEARRSITDALDGNDGRAEYAFIVASDATTAAEGLRRIAREGTGSWRDNLKAKNIAHGILRDMD